MGNSYVKKGKLFRRFGGAKFKIYEMCVWLCFYILFKKKHFHSFFKLT